MNKRGFRDNMICFLNRLTICGSKNLDKPIELTFGNKTLSNPINFSNSNVKAIYGPNGAGKSGIISAIYIYRRLVFDKNSINDSYFSRFIRETINKNTNNLSIDLVFTIMTKKTKKSSCYRHIIELSMINDEILISKEEIFKLSGRNINNDNFKRLIYVENGKLLELNGKTDSDFTSEKIYLSTLNLLDKHSIVISFYKLFGQGDNEEESDAYCAIRAVMIFCCNLIVELNNDDRHSDYIQNLEGKTSHDNIYKNFIHIIKDNTIKYNFSLSTTNADIISKNMIDAYLENVNNLTSFLKIFIPSLSEIVIDKKINNNIYYCKKIFRYDTKYIDFEFESTGIKKLVKLFTTLRLCANGCIAFIDEMDANIHDVYFTKLIEFFKNDGKGQLCFTTHNLEPIDVLKSNKHSLDFLSNDSRIYSWIKDGNKSPMQNYVNGLIPYSPFNVEAFTFDLLLDEE